MIASFSTINGAQSGHPPTITVLGLHFGEFDPTITAELSTRHRCSSASWTSVSAMQCLRQLYMPNQTNSDGVDLRLAVTVHNVASTSSLHDWFTFDAPIISGSSPRNGPRSLQMSVTFAGLNFGDSDLSGSVTISGTLDPGNTLSWTTSTTIRFLNAKIIDLLHDHHRRRPSASASL